MQPFLGQLPGRAGNGGWCAAGPCSQHEHSASELAGCGGAVGFREGVQIHLIQIKITTEIPHLRHKPALLLDRFVLTSYVISLYPKPVWLRTLCPVSTKQSGGILNRQSSVGQLGDPLLVQQEQPWWEKALLGTYSQLLPQQATVSFLTKPFPALPHCKIPMQRNSPVVGQPAGQPGSSPEQSDADHSAWLPHEPGESPQAAASHLLPLSPEI